MHKYILVDTWNGEGYSDSKAELIEAETFQAALEVAIEKAKEACGEEKEIRVINKNTAYYDVNDDNGAQHIANYEDQYGICIFPDTNQYTILPSRKAYIRAMNLSLKVAEDKEGWEVEELKENEQGQLHTSIGCEIFQKLNVLIDPTYDDLDFYDGGDGVEYEVWKDKRNENLYRVPIEIVRDFDNMEEVSSPHAAKFGE